LTLTDLAELRALGVRIENHGWTHSDPGALDEDSLVRDVVDGAGWLASRVGVESRLYAGPYGDYIPESLHRWPDGITYFADSSREKPGRLADRIYNRVSLRDTWKDKAL
jgi:peptidoglycan/xylan/chitin deacetylase (PgdA/CDA1 family)